MSKIHWTDVWKGPFKYDEGGDVYSKDNVWVFTPDISLDYDDPEIMKLIADITEVLNTGEELKEKYTGMEIVADIDLWWNGKEIGSFRGWGFLTGAMKLDEEEAAGIQDEMIAFVMERISVGWNTSEA